LLVLGNLSDNVVLLLDVGEMNISALSSICLHHVRRPRHIRRL